MRLYLDAGRRWLAWTVVAVRTLAVILNFVLSPNIIMLATKDDPSVPRIAMNAGTSAFFLKGVESGELLAGIKAVAESTN